MAMSALENYSKLKNRQKIQIKVQAPGSMPGILLTTVLCCVNDFWLKRSLRMGAARFIESGNLVKSGKFIEKAMLEGLNPLCSDN
jgi:hypothetical protein